MGKIDLHIHSTASDGRFRPEEIVCKAAALGLAVIALADHDSVAGIEPALEAAKAFPELRLIPNVEISTDTVDGEVHILGYFVNYTDAGLAAKLEDFRDSRVNRARKMVEKLRNFGIDLSWQRVQEIAGDGSVGRPHIAQAMLEKGYISSFREAFDKYISNEGPAYVEREKMTPEEAVNLVLRAGGLPVLAHPFTITDTEPMIAKLKAAGLVGIEAHYGGYTADQTARLVDIAKNHRLIASGGSDYHGIDDNMETMMGGIDIPLDSIERFDALAKQRGIKTFSK
ncbi:MAG: PHP domain-containing protein [Dehalococcoidales bacterium]|nr:PHP domain-containing protein [Dehalococcoidales bacterium]